jgi:NAD-dependent dihydropyrimidine dehydrogenase PreA subunit
LITIDSGRCDGCGACMEVCPQGALYLVNDKVMVDARLCHECEACIATCPTGAIAITSQATTPEVEPVRVPVPQTEPEAIRVRMETAPFPLRARILPMIGAVLSWAGQEIVPRLADHLIDGLDQRTTRQPVTGATRSNSSSTNRGGSGRQHRRRHRGGRRSAG